MSAAQRGLAVVALLLGAIGLFVVVAFHRPANDSRIVIRLPVKPAVVPPLPSALAIVDPTAIKPLTAAEAAKQNALVPGLTGPIPVAAPFVLPATIGSAAPRTALECLTSAVYYESAGQPLEGQRAVAQVVLNRLRHPAFPKSVCGVVFQGSDRPTGCQFTFTCDGSIARHPSPQGWAVAQKVAQAALAGAVEPRVGLSTHYHTVFVVPYWAASLQKITTLGAHIFYRFPGFWGMRAAYNGAYAGETAGPGGSPAVLSYDEVHEEAPLPDPLASKSTLVVTSAKLVPLGNGSLAIPEKNSLRADEGKAALLVDEADRLVRSVSNEGK